MPMNFIIPTILGASHQYGKSYVDQLLRTVYMLF